MQGITHVRIDDRLIHGQVALLWSSGLGISRIIVINDEVANNEVQKAVLRMAAQGKINTSILNKETACTNILSGKYSTQKCMIILKNPKDALDLMDMGLDFDSINVGNMISKDPEAIQVKRSLKLSPDEIEQFKQLSNKGVTLTSQMVPEEKITYLLDFIDHKEQ